jgi:hypothetical protein
MANDIGVKQSRSETPAIAIQFAGNLSIIDGSFQAAVFAFLLLREVS